MYKRIIYTIIITLFVPFVLYGQSKPKRDVSKDRSVVEARQQEKAKKEAYKSALEKGTKDSFKDFLKKHPKSQYAKEIKSRITEIEKKEEQDMYDDACKVETVQAYDAYLKKYPNGRYALEAKSRLEDMELWEKTKSENTIMAYKKYINISKNKGYLQLANEAITNLESIESWNHIRNSTSKSELESFINKYPKSSCSAEAQKKLDELIAVDLYEKGYLQSAFDKFESAGGRYSLSDSNRSKYDECKEFVAYKKLNSFSNESELMDFLKRYPSSKYYNQVSNCVAIVKAKNLSMFSNSYNYNEALMYAKDKTTRNTVQNYIDDAKKTYKKYKKQQRIDRMKANGGLVKYGVEIMDFGFAGLSNTNVQRTLYYNLGFGVKLGNYSSPIQYEMGIKLGVVYTFVPYHNDNHLGTKTYFHLPIFAKLKLNLCGLGSSKFYIAGIGTFNAIKEKGYENDFSVGGGAGFAWKKWDWFVLYYKQDIQNKTIFNNKSLGTSFVYYF